MEKVRASTNAGRRRWLIAAMRRTKLNAHQIADLTGVSHGHIRNVKSGRKNLSESTYRLLKILIQQ